MTTEIRKEKERVFLDHIPVLRWGEGMDNSFVRSVQLTLNAIGENYSYIFLMGVSGAAFRLHFHNEWLADSADATTGFDVSKILFSSLGYEADLHSINKERPDEVKSLYRRLTVQIDRGIPVIAGKLKGDPGWGIIAGYLKNRTGLVCRTFFDQDEEYAQVDTAPENSFFIDKAGHARDYKELFRDSVRTAIHLAKTKSFSGYRSGFSAFETWIGKLNELPDLLGDKELRSNAIIFNCLADARQAAAGYMTLMNNHIDLKNGDRIVAGYSDEVDLLNDVREDLNRLAGSALAGSGAGEGEMEPQIRDGTREPQTRDGAREPQTRDGTREPQTRGGIRKTGPNGKEIQVLLKREAEVLVRVLDIEKEVIRLMEG